MIISCSHLHGNAALLSVERFTFYFQTGTTASSQVNMRYARLHNPSTGRTACGCIPLLYGVNEWWVLGIKGARQRAIVQDLFLTAMATYISLNKQTTVEGSRTQRDYCMNTRARLGVCEITFEGSRRWALRLPDPREWDGLKLQSSQMKRNT